MLRRPPQDEDLWVFHPGRMRQKRFRDDPYYPGLNECGWRKEIHQSRAFDIAEVIELLTAPAIVPRGQPKVEDRIERQSGSDEHQEAGRAGWTRQVGTRVQAESISATARGSNLAVVMRVRFVFPHMRPRRAKNLAMAAGLPYGERP